MSFTDDPDEEEYGEVEEQSVEQLVDQAIRAHHAKQATWTEPTDCDKLDTAFATMEARGLVARQNFTCCNTCGRAEIWDEIVAAEESREVIGYAFYHMQDTESAVEGGSIYIKYGAVVGGSAVEVGQRILDSLHECRVDADWSGSANDAVKVSLADWRKRRVNELPLSDEPE